jgi:hypothetical protein
MSPLVSSGPVQGGDQGEDSPYLQLRLTRARVKPDGLDRRRRRVDPVKADSPSSRSMVPKPASTGRGLDTNPPSLLRAHAPVPKPSCWLWLFPGHARLLLQPMNAVPIITQISALSHF